MNRRLELVRRCILEARTVLAPSVFAASATHLLLLQIAYVCYVYRPSWASLSMSKKVCNNPMMALRTWSSLCCTVSRSGVGENLSASAFAS